MSLRGGAIKINGTTNKEIEGIFQEIMEDENTTIELLREGKNDPHYVYKIGFDNKKFSKYFVSTQNIVNGRVLTTRVLIIKILTHYEKFDVNSGKLTNNPNEHHFEVTVHKYLSLSRATHAPICPSFLYSKRTKLGKSGQSGSLEEAICNKLEATTQEFNLYAQLKAKTVEQLLSKNPGLGQATFVFDFEDATQTIIFMEYADCESLSAITTDKLHTMSNLQENILPFANSDLEPIETRTEGFICFVLLYVSILLLKEGIIHGDLHPGNVLICIDRDGFGIMDTVVIDFGRSAFTSNLYISSNLYLNGLKSEEYKAMLLPNTLTIFDEIIGQTVFPPDKYHAKQDMSQYFNHLLAKEDYVKAAIASTMFYSPGEYRNNYNYSLFDLYVSELIKEKQEVLKEKQTYAPIFQYERLPYDFNELIKNTLDTSSLFYKNKRAKMSLRNGLELRKRSLELLKKLPPHLFNTLGGPRVNPKIVLRWIKNNMPEVASNKNMREALIDEWKAQVKAKPPKESSLIDEWQAQVKAKPPKESSLTRARAALASFGSMLSKNPKAYKTVSDRDLSTGGKGTRRSYHNYKKTQKSRVYKIYSKKRKTKRKNRKQK
uniref:Protein kinase domain-containing protein n=1 Tax=viral metagenome TaxID=1070528 RepID=A0A6C0DXU6_9ZZZZ